MEKKILKSVWKVLGNLELQIINYKVSWWITDRPMDHKKQLKTFIRKREKILLGN